MCLLSSPPPASLLSDTSHADPGPADGQVEPRMHSAGGAAFERQPGGRPGAWGLSSSGIIYTIDDMVYLYLYEALPGLCSSVGFCKLPVQSLPISEQHTTLT